MHVVSIHGEGIMAGITEALTFGLQREGSLGLLSSCLKYKYWFCCSFSTVYFLSLRSHEKPATICLCLYKPLLTDTNIGSSKQRGGGTYDCRKANLKKTINKPLHQESRHNRKVLCCVYFKYSKRW